MYNSLPSTPAEVLDLTPELPSLIQESIIKNSASWSYPFKDAATSLEEMGLDDMAYWVFKCTRPITRIEKGLNPQDTFFAKSNVVKLPSGFQKTRSVSMAAVGDLLHANGLEYSKDILFEHISDLLFDKDISFANFESPITQQKLIKEVIGNKAPIIECCSREQFEILTQYNGKGFNVLNTANNHMFDMGLEGIDTTLKTFLENGILDVGTNQAKEEYGNGKILKKNDIKIGFVSAAFGLNGQKLPAGEEYRINISRLLSRSSPPQLDLLKSQIDDCKKKKCDFIIASLHTGYEFEFFPRKQQIDTAHEIAEYGADAIISHHPHVVAPVEYYHTLRDSNRIVPINYSMGSLTWGFSAPHLVLSFIQNYTLTKGMHNCEEKTYVEAVNTIPVFRSITNDNGKIITKIEKLFDHTDSRSTYHAPEYINQIKKYSDLVLK